MTARPSAGRDTVDVQASDVRAFRLHAHHLTCRRPADDLLAVAGACGVQDSPPGSALLALNARVADVTSDRVEHLVREEKSLLQSWSMRGAPFWFPTADAQVFTAGVLPATEAARLHLIVGVEQALHQLGMGLDEATGLVAAEIEAVLSGRQLPIDELGDELANRIAAVLPPAQRKTWLATGPYAANQPMGEAVVHFCLRMLTLRGIVCLAPRAENKAPFVLVDEWLGRPLPKVDPEVARASLLRRYLHCYGPSTRQDFASWVGVRTGDVDPWWGTLADELMPVEYDGRQAWLLADGLAALQSPPEARGVRLLPPHDPYTQQRDRDTIVDRAHQREVWRPLGDPGVLLVDGNITGTWRPRKRGSTLTLTVTPFRSLGRSARDQLVDEAERVAELRGATSVEVVHE